MKNLFDAKGLYVFFALFILFDFTVRGYFPWINNFHFDLVTSSVFFSFLYQLPKYKFKISVLYIISSGFFRSGSTMNPDYSNFYTKICDEIPHETVTAILIIFWLLYECFIIINKCLKNNKECRLMHNNRR